MIADRLNVEKHRAGNMAAAILGMSVALLRRQEIRGVDRNYVAVTQVIGEPVGRNQPAACRGGGEGIVGSEHGDHLETTRARPRCSGVGNYDLRAALEP